MPTCLAIALIVIGAVAIVSALFGTADIVQKRYYHDLPDARRARGLPPLRKD